MDKKDFLVRGMTADGFVKITAVQSTQLVERARQIHKTLPLATAALGRTLTAASMMGNELKYDKGSVTLQLRGDGPLGAITTVSDSNGNVRGYLQNPAAVLPLRADGHLNVGAGVGREGLLTVIKDIGEREPFTGRIELQSGEIAEDVAAYYVLSEQIPTVCGLGVLVNPDLTPKAAGGFLLQVLPGGDDKTIEQLEKNVQAMPPVTVMLEQGLTPEEICIKALEGLSPQILSKQTVSYQCDCTRERTDRGLLTLRKEGLRQLIEEDGKAELCCHFCEKKYRYNKKELEALLAQAEI